MKIIGNTVGTPLPKPNLMQTDPRKGDYVKGKEEFVEQVGGGGSGGGQSIFHYTGDLTNSESLTVITSHYTPTTGYAGDVVECGDRDIAIGDLVIDTRSNLYEVAEVIALGSYEQAKAKLTFLAKLTEDGADGKSIFYLRFSGTDKTDTYVGKIAIDTGDRTIQVGDLLVSTVGYLYQFTGYDDYGNYNIKYLTSLNGAKGDKGDKGDTGAAGANGVSATHSWNGTTLTVTSASGTSSADLKGEKGEKGDKGEPGSNATVTIDSSLSSTSTNPVQNKVVTAKFNSLARRMSEVGWNGTTDTVAYYEIGRMPAYNSGDNRGSVLLTGRLGHWIASSIANFTILLSNRSGCQASVFAQGNVTGALNCCDIEVYRQTDDTDIIYMKTKGYWVFDLEYVANQVTMQYKNVQVTPTGTKVWALSEEKRVSTDFQGAMTANEFKGKFTATEDPTTAMGVATKQYVDDQIATKVAEPEDLVGAVLNALPTWNGGNY